MNGCVGRLLEKDQQLRRSCKNFEWLGKSRSQIGIGSGEFELISFTDNPAKSEIGERGNAAGDLETCCSGQISAISSGDGNADLRFAVKTDDIAKRIPKADDWLNGEKIARSFDNRFDVETQLSRRTGMKFDLGRTICDRDFEIGRAHV